MKWIVLLSPAFKFLCMFGKQRASGLRRQLQYPETARSVCVDVIVTGALVEQGDEMAVLFAETQSNVRSVYGCRPSANAELQGYKQNSPAPVVPTFE
ncbi:MAG: hypothetical protein ACM3VT_06925 [Solirubrobacterales bacterium]